MFIQLGISQCSLGTISVHYRLDAGLVGGQQGGSTVSNFCFRDCSCALLEFFCEFFIIKKRPRVVEFMVPCSLQVPHRL